VISWYAGLLEIEVDGVLLEATPADPLSVGTRVLGAFDGALPCYRGVYLPKAGDRVIAFLVPDSEAKPWCCQLAACEVQCAEDPIAEDTCLAECQSQATEACAAEFEGVKITGYLRATPFDPDSVELAHAGEVSFSVNHDDLALIFEGDDVCDTELGEVRDVLGSVADDPSALQPPQWRESCPELSEP
jgi:hypothetical protein